MLTGFNKNNVSGFTLWAYSELEPQCFLLTAGLEAELVPVE